MVTESQDLSPSVQTLAQELPKVCLVACPIRRPPLRHATGFPAMLMALVLACTGQAAATPADLCDAATSRAAAATGVPLAVLQAIALTESGRSHQGRLRAWPWTLNAAGQSYWLAHRQGAEAQLRRLMADGVRSIDIGCFQVNLRWHGQAFASPEALFDPEANALYAARFLAGLEAELGSWEAAAGAYHSRTPALAERYTARFRTHLARLQAAQPAAAPHASRQTTGEPPGATELALAGTPRQRRHAYPLLQPGPAAGLGSTVPQGDSRGSLILAAARPLQ